MRKLLIGTVIATLLSTSVLAVAQEPSQRGGHKHGKEHTMMKELGLSAQQQADIKQIRAEARQDASIYREEHKAFRQSIKAIMESGEWNEAQVKSLIEENATSAKQLKLIKAKSKNRIFNVLNTEQKSAMAEKRAQKKAERAERGSRDGLAGLKMKRLTKRLALSDEQQEAFSALISDAKTQRQANKADNSAKKEELKLIIQAAEFDQDAWSTFYESNNNGHVEKALAKTKLRFDMLNILDEDQKAKFEKMMRKGKKGKKGMRAKRNERGADQA